ncbi:hypothetical protein KI387_026450, partial [Taxus chinensis]
VEEDPKQAEEVEILDSGENNDRILDLLGSSLDKATTDGDNSDEGESEKSLDSAHDKCSKNSEYAIESLHALKTTQSKLFTAQDSVVKPHSFMWDFEHFRIDTNINRHMISMVSMDLKYLTDKVEKLSS